MKVAEGRALRYEVAEKAGLPLDAARRLNGETEAELAADATELLELLSLRGRVTPPGFPNDGRRPGGNDGRPVGPRDYVKDIYH